MRSFFLSGYPLMDVRGLSAYTYCTCAFKFSQISIHEIYTLTLVSNGSLLNREVKLAGIRWFDSALWGESDRNKARVLYVKSYLPVPESNPSRE